MAASRLVRRPRQSPWPAISMEEALNIVHQHSSHTRVVEVTLNELKAGDVIAHDVHAPCPHPRFRTSRMDGYAFKSVDGQGIFHVIGGISAGSSARTLEIPPRHCYRINTGGVVPDDADTVVPVEYTQLLEHDNQNELVIDIQRHMTSGSNIRDVGSDISSGQLLIPKDSILDAAQIGLLAGCAPMHIKMFKRPRIGVLSTGDELRDPVSKEKDGSSSLEEGQIWDSNRLMLIEMFKERGFEVWNGGIVRDSPELIRKAIMEGFKECDALVLSGGVSMGDKDLLKGVLQDDLEFKIHFGRVEMKPGLPNTFASGQLFGKKCVVFGLPGNPVSAFVSAHLFVIPWARANSGYGWKEAQGTTLNTRINASYRLDSRPEYLRACIQFSEDQLPEAHVISTNQVSSRLVSASNSNLLLKLPPKSEQKTEILSGEIVERMMLLKIVVDLPRPRSVSVESAS